MNDDDHAFAALALLVGATVAVGSLVIAPAATGFATESYTASAVAFGIAIASSPLTVLAVYVPTFMCLQCIEKWSKKGKAE